jgi:hypothetical protein
MDGGDDDEDVVVGWKRKEWKWKIGKIGKEGLGWVRLGRRNREPQAGRGPLRLPGREGMRDAVALGKV